MSLIRSKGKKMAGVEREEKEKGAMLAALTFEAFLAMVAAQGLPCFFRLQERVSKSNYHLQRSSYIHSVFTVFTPRR